MELIILGATFFGFLVLGVPVAFAIGLSAICTILSTLRTVASSNPWAIISSALWHCSTCSSRIWSSSS